MNPTGFLLPFLLASLPSLFHGFLPSFLPSFLHACLPVLPAFLSVLLVFLTSLFPAFLASSLPFSLLGFFVFLLLIPCAGWGGPFPLISLYIFTFCFFVDPFLVLFNPYWIFVSLFGVFDARPLRGLQREPAWQQSQGDASSEKLKDLEKEKVRFVTYKEPRAPKS